MKRQYVLIAIATLLGIAITAFARNTDSLFSFPGLPGSVLSRSATQIVGDRSFTLIYWLANVLFWSAIFYGCLRIVFPTTQEGTSAPWHVSSPTSFAPIVLSFFVIYPVAAKYVHSFYKSILAKPAESIWCPCSLGPESDWVILANIVFWAVVTYGLCVFIAKTTFRRQASPGV